MAKNGPQMAINGPQMAKNGPHTHVTWLDFLGRETTAACLTHSPAHPWPLLLLAVERLPWWRTAESCTPTPTTFWTRSRAGGWCRRRRRRWGRRRGGAGSTLPSTSGENWNILQFFARWYYSWYVLFLEEKSFLFYKLNIPSLFYNSSISSWCVVVTGKALFQKLV